MTRTPSGMRQRLIPDYFFERVAQHPDSVAYADRVATAGGATWVTCDWRNYGVKVRKVAASLLAFGVTPGERIAILASNRSEWTIADMAAMAIGAVPVGVYTTSAPAQVEHILRDSIAAVLVLENDDHFVRLRDRLADCPALRHVVVIEGTDGLEGCTPWNVFVDRVEPKAAQAAVDEARAKLRPEQMASLVYTSGTTGAPKGVMLTHGNLVAITKMGLQALSERRPDDRVLSYLPLAHVAERGISTLGPSMAGYAAYFCRSIEELPTHLSEVRPTIFLGVPRLWEKIRHAIEEKARQAVLPRRILARWALATSSNVNGMSGRVSRTVADRLVLQRVRATLGLDQAHTVVTGAAPVSVDVLEFFARLGVEIRQVYGLSECGGPATFNRRGEGRRDSVGRPFDGCDIRVSDGGEILIRGPHVFDGYLGDEEATRAVMQDGWLRSGDLGSIDDDGFLTIKGRIKDVIITGGGKNVSPATIERRLVDHPYIADAVLVGDGRKFLTALLTFVDDVPQSLADVAGPGVILEPGDADVLRKHVLDVNKTLSRAEQVKRFTVLGSRFSTETGELTPTRKLRRAFICEKYAAEIDRMYSVAILAEDRATPNTATN